MTNKFILTKLKTQMATKFKSQNVIQTSNSYHKKNPAYGEQRISWPMRIVGPIQFWRGCLIYQKEERIYICIYIFKKKLKQFSSKICGTIFFKNLWNYLSPKLWNSFPPKTLIQIASKIFEKIFLKNHWKYFPLCKKSEIIFYGYQILPGKILTKLEIRGCFRNMIPRALWKFKNILKNCVYIHERASNMVLNIFLKNCKV
jgi:hypothetical protein